MPNKYWEGSPEKWALISAVQEAKRDYTGDVGFTGPSVRYGQNISDSAVIINPVTGREVPMADLQYAKDNLQYIYESGMIKDDRWAFLWYH
jgi:hypothetical protein